MTGQAMSDQTPWWQFSWELSTGWSILASIGQVTPLSQASKNRNLLSLGRERQDTGTKKKRRVEHPCSFQSECSPTTSCGWRQGKVHPCFTTPKQAKMGWVSLAKRQKRQGREQRRRRDEELS
ncbi:hypothetical protein MGYG_07954 [Nannizzia gypsea CBS 118893]|uniref:Uncharacterized protein n=1 Tax=Arthroderma gypseum (strain ATCC MYA-4604 / CBS 118893) TaxID=535722 RepID=E4V4M8_ARTGP|nr:hypothetical protein MGYG_07954 [Nannizzia gypsea CBS 118893]EFR04952.1 hypothetical protein MGYG_07954 [Nannizzia gypsea CBS 118893]